MTEQLDIAKLLEIAEKAKAGLADGSWTRDQRTYWIWAPSLKGGHAHIADIRGWGYLTGGGHGALGLSEEAAIEAQNAWADHIAAFSPDLVLALLADNARKDQAIKAAAVYLDTLGDNLLRNDADMLLDECRDPKDVAAGLRQALSGANHAD